MKVKYLVTASIAALASCLFYIPEILASSQRLKMAEEALIGAPNSEKVLQHLTKGLDFDSAVKMSAQDGQKEAVYTAVAIVCDQSISGEQKGEMLKHLVKEGLKYNLLSPTSNNYSESVDQYLRRVREGVFDLQVELGLLRSLRQDMGMGSSIPIPPAPPQTVMAPTIVPQASPPPIPLMQVATSTTSEEQLIQLQERISELEKTIARLSGVSVKVSHGTIVWVPFNHPAGFIHDSNLKPQQPIDDAAFRAAIKKVSDYYKDVISATVKPLHKSRLSTLAELDPEVAHTFIAAHSQKVTIESVVNSPSITTADREKKAKFFELFEKAAQEMEFYQAQKSRTLPGLEEYIDLQKSFRALMNELPVEDFIEFMNKFETKKKIFSQTLKGKINPSKSAAFHKLIDEIDLAKGTFTAFLRTFKSEPTEKSVKGYNDLPFVLMHMHTATGNDFSQTLITNKTRYNRDFNRHELLEEGLEAEYPIKLLMDMHPDLEDRIMTLERMYMMEHFKTRWNVLKEHFNDLSLKMNAFNGRGDDGKLLLSADLKGCLSTIFQEGDAFLGKALHTHLGACKIFEDNLRPALQYMNAIKWGGHEELREGLVELYVSYTGIVSHGKAVHSKNVKIQEFHNDPQN